MHRGPVRAVIVSVAFWQAGGTWWYHGIFVGGLFVAALGLGLYSATRRAFLAELTDRAERLERERDQQVALAAAAERTRIAREMHDIVAHHLTVMVTLSEAAAAVRARRSRARRRDHARRVRGRPGRARRHPPPARRAAHSDSARAGGAADALRPVPGLAQLDELVGQVRSAGLDTTLEISGQVPELSEGMQLTVYRLVQEALTNTLKHAGQGASATVRLGFLPGELRVDIHDDGTRHRGHSVARHAGSGLLGMRERARAFGGEVEAGPLEPHGWKVSARLLDAGRRMIRVLLADDQALLRMGFRMILEAQPDIEVAGEASDGAAAIAMTMALHPDVVLMDVRMPGMDGIQATEAPVPRSRTPRCSSSPPTTWTSTSSPGSRPARAAFLLKDAPPEELLTAIRTVADGEAVLAPTATRRLIDQFAPLLPDPAQRHDKQERLGKLTDRERPSSR